MTGKVAPGTLAEQIAQHRQQLASVAGLVACMPTAPTATVQQLSTTIAQALVDLERLARRHQPKTLQP